MPRPNLKKALEVTIGDKILTATKASETVRFQEKNPPQAFAKV
ncbi:MAG: hypothetical protein ONB44_23365 [candidate division KSB1 bacterium]|nr:hypothetical protein [candidate division KSB1 bacterium]MDZ7305081.1 hypothetical protein [candidate division KSB1 bacterium]MDZ7313550.1 hypothetical protein [candidate division KSB1 bacterium]